MKKLILLLITVIPLIGFSQTDSTKLETDSLKNLKEVLPKYPGGEAEMYKFISKNLKYPKSAMEEAIEGTVLVRFFIDKEGNVINPKVIKDIGYGCGEEALRVVKKMPKWTPGTLGDKPIKVSMMLPFQFKIF